MGWTTSRRTLKPRPDPGIGGFLYSAPRLSRRTHPATAPNAPGPHVPAWRHAAHPIRGRWARPGAADTGPCTDLSNQRVLQAVPAPAMVMQISLGPAGLWLLRSAAAPTRC